MTPILHCNIDSRNGSMSLGILSFCFSSRRQHHFFLSLFILLDVADTLLCLKWDTSFTLNHILRWVKEFLRYLPLLHFLSCLSSLSSLSLASFAPLAPHLSSAFLPLPRSLPLSLSLPLSFPLRPLFSNLLPQ